MNRTLTTVLIICFGIILLPAFTGHPPAAASEALPKAISEEFDPVLFHKIKSVDDLENFLELNYKGEKNSVAFLDHMSSVISKRFYHSYSYYNNSNNWVAALSGQLLWKDLSAIVLPDDILKHPNAACSQQTIVLMECAKRFGLSYRKILFDHHFAAEVRVQGKWRYIDANLEVKALNESLDDLVREGKLYALYKNKISESELKNILANPKYGRADEQPAAKAVVFQKISSWISDYFLWILILLQCVLFYLYQRKDQTA